MTRRVRDSQEAKSGPSGLKLLSQLGGKIPSLSQTRRPPAGGDGERAHLAVQEPHLERHPSHPDVQGVRREAQGRGMGAAVLPSRSWGPNRGCGPALRSQLGLLALGGRGGLDQPRGDGGCRRDAGDVQEQGVGSWLLEDAGAVPVPRPALPPSPPTAWDFTTLVPGRWWRKEGPAGTFPGGRGRAARELDGSGVPPARALLLR
jgi:hypothetical protein